jgi:hypothetical protein
MLPNLSKCASKLKKRQKQKKTQNVFKEGRNKYYLSASNNGKIHQRLDVVVPRNLEKPWFPATA